MTSSRSTKTPSTYPPTPLRNNYWVVPGKVLAGEHPGGTNVEATRERLSRLIAAGVECFIDLTEPNELRGYDRELPYSVEYLRKPIKDHGIPSQKVHMMEILDCIHDALQSGRCVYIHCRAGIGRTGTVVGCFLAERGYSGEEALDELNRLWQQCERSSSWGNVPETNDQTDYVARWKPRGIFDDMGQLKKADIQPEADDEEPGRSANSPWAHLIGNSKSAPSSAPPTSSPASADASRDTADRSAPSASSDAASSQAARSSSTATPPRGPASVPLTASALVSAGPAGRAAAAAAARASANPRAAGSAPARAAPIGGAHPEGLNPDDVLTDPTSVAKLPQPPPLRRPPAASGNPSWITEGVGWALDATPQKIPPVSTPGAFGTSTRGPQSSATTGSFPTASASAASASGPSIISASSSAAAPAASDPLLEDPEALAAVDKLRQRFLGALVGLAVGDAVAAATQYRKPGTFQPVGDMLGGGPFDLPRGAWTDDTSMALCLADSLLERNGFDARDQMERYSRWKQQGYLSSTGQCVGITANAAKAIAMSQWRRQAFFGSHDPFLQDAEPLSRVAPAVLFFFANSADAVNQCTESARTTCQAPAVLEACRSLARAVHAALSGQPKAVVLERAAMPPLSASASDSSTPHAAPPPRTSITAPAALSAAVAAFGATDNFRDAILYAVNLGGDSDVVAAVCGQIAGAHYGVKAIPTSWYNGLMQKDLIVSYADRLLAHALVGLGN